MNNGLALDSWQDWSVLVAIISAIALFYWSKRRDKREAKASANEDVKAALEVKDATIAGFEKQNSLLKEQLDEMKRQGEEREIAWKRREADWKRREEKFEKRVENMQEDYRSLVLTITSMRMCANASTCADYNPGDRRSHPDIPEGTD